MDALINLLATLYVFAGPFLLARMAGNYIWPLVLAFLYVISAIIASAMIYTPSFGYGGWLMLTLPFSPVLLLYGWLMIKLMTWWSAKTSVIQNPQTHQFGRS